MRKINLFVCDNFAQDYMKAVENEALKHVAIKAFPSMCENKSKKSDALKLLQESAQSDSEGLILCGKSCCILERIPKFADIRVRTSELCFNHLATDEQIQKILEQGGYIIGIGWLNDWENHIQEAGFNQEIAKQFYTEFCRELVFFDGGYDLTVEEKLNGLSEFLSIPYNRIPFKLESIQSVLNDIIDSITP